MKRKFLERAHKIELKKFKKMSLPPLFYRAEDIKDIVIFVNIQLL